MRVLSAIGGLLMLLACTNAPPRPPESKVPDRIPLRLEFENEISGRLLAYDLKQPSGLALDVAGNLFISDAGNHRLIKLAPDLKPIRDYGGYGSGVGQFHNPEDIVIDRGLNLYILDASNRRVIRLDVNFNYIEEIIPEDDSSEIISTLGRLSGLHISPLGEMTVADYDNSRLIKLDNFNRFSRYVGDFAYGRGALLNPLGLALGDDGRSYAADGGNGRIAVYDDYGNYLYQVDDGDMTRPSAVTVDSDGIIWVADEEQQTLFVFASDGRRLLRTGGPGKDDYSFADIQALAVSPDGRLFVADTGNNRVLIYRIVYEAVR